MYSKYGDDPLTKLWAGKTPGKHKPGRRGEQPLWLTKEVETLWKRKREACRQSQSHREDRHLKEEARRASNEFEKAARSKKEKIYKDFSQNVTEDRTQDLAVTQGHEW